jgi:hypothetical protein
MLTVVMLVHNAPESPFGMLTVAMLVHNAPESPFGMLTVAMLVHNATYRTNYNINIIGF